jgi:formamidopyrimidine-DNA glycosylase
MFELPEYQTIAAQMRERIAGKRVLTGTLGNSPHKFVWHNVSHEEFARKGGRSDEFDLHGNPGGYARLMDTNAEGRPCPACGTRVLKIAYLGGACYFCPKCQPFVGPSIAGKGSRGRG